MADAALSERLPTQDETKKASEAIGALAKAVTNEGTLPIRISEDGNEITVDLPPAIGDMMLELLGHIARGEMVTVVPYGGDLTTQQAGDLLNVSRPFLIKLLENGEIPHHRVGAHRRVLVKDMLSYKIKRDQDRAANLKKLQKLGQEYDAA